MKLISTPNIRSPWLLGQVYDVEGSEYGTHHYLSMILGVSSFYFSYFGFSTSSGLAQYPRCFSRNQLRSATAGVETGMNCYSHSSTDSIGGASHIRFWVISLVDHTL